MTGVEMHPTWKRSHRQGRAPLVTRRSWLSGAATLVSVGGVLRSAPTLALVAPARRGGRVSLTVYVHMLPALNDADLSASVRQAFDAVGGSRAFDLKYLGGNPAVDGLSWFPGGAAISGMAGPGADLSKVRWTDDSSVAMPDIVLATHDLMPDFLATRALDLQPVLRNAPAVGASSAVVRQGRAFAPGRGTIQAAIPVLRRPMVCSVRKDRVPLPMSPIPWSTLEFSHVLQQAKGAFGIRGGVLAYVPFAQHALTGADNPRHSLPWLSGLEVALAVGHGGVLARSEPFFSTPAFVTGTALQGLLDGIAWKYYAPDYTQCGYNDLTAPFGVFMGWLSEAIGIKPATEAPNVSPLSECAPLSQGMTAGCSATGGVSLRSYPSPPGAGGSSGWTLAPLPRFPQRPAVPTNNLDVMVAKDSAHAEAAADLIAHLTAPAPQQRLAEWGSALSVDPAIAARQLSKWTDAGTAGVIADPSYDVTAEDGYGTETVHNEGEYARVRRQLANAVAELTGLRGGFFLLFKSDGTPECYTRNVDTRSQWLSVLRGRTTVQPQLAGP